MKNFIMNHFNLEEDMIEKFEEVRIENKVQFYITLSKTQHVCPECKTITARVKGYKDRTLVFKFFEEEKSEIIYHQRRYLCPNCGRSFVENDPFGTEEGKITFDTVKNILKDLKPYTSTFAFVANKYEVSSTTIVNIFDQHVQIDRKPLTEILCWDEFYFDRNSQYKYAFTILDFDHKVILDIVESRQQQKLVDYFHNIPKSERDKVKVIIIDMYDTYKSIQKIFFKNAVLVVDSFHVVKQINEGLDTIRKKVMRKAHKEGRMQDYGLLKHRNKILFKDKAKIDVEKFYYDRVLGYHTTELGVLDQLLKTDKTLEKAYNLSQEFIRFNATLEEEYDPERKDKQLNQIIKDYLESGIKEFIEKGKTLSTWKIEILNSFKWHKGRRLSNGPIEGKNNYINKILSNANGYHNFARARNKIMYSQNLYESYSVLKNRTPVKKQGLPRGKYKKNKK